MAPKKPPGRPPAKATIKTKAAASSAAGPRRSERQATKTAKAAEQEDAQAPHRVSKKAAPEKTPATTATPGRPAAKKTAPAPKKTPAKPAAKKAAPTKATAKKPTAKKTAGPEPEDEVSEAETTASDKSARRKADFTKAFNPSKSSAPARRPGKAATSKAPEKKPVPKKTATRSSDLPAPVSRGRGRPKKTASAASGASNASRPSGVSKAARNTKTRKPTKKPDVAAPDDNEEWTDSPKKTSPYKRQAKVSSKSKAAVDKVLQSQNREHLTDERGRAESVGGVRKSIEPAGRGASSRHRSKSQSRSPPRGASKSPGRKTTKTSKRAATRSGSVQAIGGLKSTRLQDESKKRQAARGSRQAAGGGGVFSEGLVEYRKKLAEERRARGSRDSSLTSDLRSKSPSKPASRNASRSPSASAVPKPIRVQKTRSHTSRSPSKGKSPSPKRKRQANASEQDEGAESPRSESLEEMIRERAEHRRNAGLGYLDESLIDSYPPISIRPSRSPSRAGSMQREWDHFFVENDEYGRRLRAIEADAYQARKNGTEMMDRDDYVTEDCQRRAQNRGIQRAEKEANLRMFDGSKRLTKKGAKPKPAIRSKQLRSPSRSPSIENLRSRGSDYQPPEDNADDDDDDDLDPGHERTNRTAPSRKRRTNSTTAYQPPKDGQDEEDHDIGPDNDRSGGSSPARKRRANSTSAYRPRGDEDDEDEVPTGRSRKSPVKKGRAANGAMESRRRSPATIRKQGGWLGKNSRPSLKGEGNAILSSSPAPPKNGSSPATKGKACAKKGPSTAQKANRSQSESHRTTGANRDPQEPLPPDQPSAPGRGTIRSVTNPEFIPGTDKRNPLFETMPGPEVWHRNMPPVFPYGETPFMQREMSRRITQDLAGDGGGEKGISDESPGIFSRFKSSFDSMCQRVLGSPSRQRPPAWELPEVSEDEVDRAVREMEATQRSASGASNGRKRKAANEARSLSPRKRARSRSTGGRRSA